MSMRGATAPAAGAGRAPPSCVMRGKHKRAEGLLCTHLSGRRCAIGPLLRAHIWRRWSGITGAPMAAQTVCGVLVLLLVQLSTCASGCSTNADCSLLGECKAGVCLCDPGWSGLDCAALALKPSRPIALPGGAPGSSGSSYVAPDGYSSWGMSVVRDVHGDGQYHGFVSQFKYGCDLDTWGTNSYVNHVVSARPTGPWKQAGIALETWAHNPKVIWSAQDKTWVMYHIGTGNDPNRAVNCTGSPGVSDGTLHPRKHASVDEAVGSSRPFQISYADSLNGPWTSLSEAKNAAMTDSGELGSVSSSSLSTLFTAYPGVDNVGGGQKPVGGVHLYEDPKHGAGVAFVSFGNFSANPARKGALAWDACGGPPLTFDNGHPIEIVGVGANALTYLTLTALHYRAPI